MMPTDPLSLDPTALAVWISALVVLAALALVGLTVLARRRDHSGGRPGSSVRTLLVGVAVASAVGVAVVGGVRSFEAVSDRFGSPMVPLTADGMIVACTALRIVALTKGWRIPGALATTYLFIGGTVWLNVAASHDWSDAVAHALAPISYAILVEMLAHLLRLHLHLANPPRQRVAALAWVTSPIVTTRVWLHLARTGTDDPVAARALIQQLIRLSSRLRMVCPGSRVWLFGQHRRTRTAALQVVRDGLLTAHQLAELLPSDGQRLDPAVLLARIDQSALGCTAPARTGAPNRKRTGAEAGAPEAPAAAAPKTVSPDAPETPEAPLPGARRPERRLNGNGPTRRARGGTATRSDDEMVAELHRIGGPMSGRKVMKILGVGWPRAKRLVDLAGWAEPSAARIAMNGHPGNGDRPAEAEQSRGTAIEPTGHTEPRTTP